MAKFKYINNLSDVNNPCIYNGYTNIHNQFDILGYINWPNNKEYYIGEWYNGNRTGMGIYKFSTGDTYFGNFKNAMRSGIGLYAKPKGEFYLGSFANNYRNGLGVHIFENGDFIFGTWANGKIHGKAIYYHADTKQVEQSLYENGEEKKEYFIEKPFICEGKWDSTPIVAEDCSINQFGYLTGTTEKGLKWEYNGQLSDQRALSGVGLIEYSDDSYIFGQFENNATNGLNITKTKDNNYTIGMAKKNINNGKILSIATSHKRVYFAENINGVREGNGFILYQSGELYYGNFVKGLLQGNVLIIDKDFGVSYNDYQDNRYIQETYAVKFNNDFPSNSAGNNNSNGDAPANDTPSQNPFEALLGMKGKQSPSPDAAESSTNSAPKVDAQKELENLVGLATVKRELNRIKAFTIKNKGKNVNLHMTFLGNPGTGKTVVARLLGQILHEAGVLKNNKFVECSRESLIGMYIGETAIKTRKAIDEAMGGVLFIDEAYSLYQKGSEKDFGHEAIVELLKAMEDHRGEFCCIMAGYTNEMLELFNMNPGFKSRVQFFIKFPDYSFDELAQIGKIMLKGMDYVMDEDALNLTVKIAYNKHNKPNFSNAREVRNILEKTAIIQAERTIENFEDRTITVEDVELFAKENNIDINQEENTNPAVPMVDINYLQELAKAFVKKNVIENMVDVKEAIISLKVKMPSGNSESSGFIITPDGYAVTCAHCVNGEQGIQVRRRILDRRGNEVDVYYKAVLVAMDIPADVAVIKILELTGDNAYIPLLPRGEKDYDALDDIIMLGYPFGVSRFDNVSTNLGKIVSYQNRQDGPDFINIDLSAKSGNSGSGVLNLQAGYAIGVLCGGNLSHNGSLVEEVNYCRPISYVWDLIERNQEQKDENKGE